MSDCHFGFSPVNYPDPDPENHLANHAVNGLWFGNNAYTRLITHMQIRYNAIRNGF